MSLVVVAPNLSGADQKRPDQHPPCVFLVGEDRRGQVVPPSSAERQFFERSKKRKKGGGPIRAMGKLERQKFPQWRL